MNSLKLILTNLKYFAPVWVFSSLNFIIGTWVLYIPYVKEKLKLNDSELGLALFCLALGVLLFIPFVPFLSKKIGLGRYTLIGVLLFSMAFLLPLLAPSYLTLCASLFFAGIFLGTTDVAMNALVSEVERRNSCNIMSAAHGFFSLGGVLGAMFGSFLMPFFSKPFYHMVVMVLFIILVNLILGKYYLHIAEKAISKEKTSFHFKTLKPLYVIALIAFVIMCSEGAIEHWSTLYFTDVVRVAKNNLAGIGFIVFSTTMTIGRFFGDKISERIGSIKIILLGCILACFGYLCILSAHFFITILGFGIIGLGLSVIIPELFRIAGKTKGIKASVGISFVSGVGFVGFLLGPVILGYISNAFSLKISFFSLLLLTILASLILLFKKNNN
ncbi:MFS transporter [Sabulilitoribacter multivorans]|uniref:MFS transporter n=1 Tax=Flaviramulus multivorans TaxID=1304750 RepID=A0ABS9II64_9FLAO|nr:MFS transporter [Flaviramulus multivorans]MCF7560462.1 MFS transporter [Flaviramulus multivorans]